jgi:hypothetical protein
MTTSMTVRRSAGGRPWSFIRTSWAGCAKALALDADGEDPDDEDE